MFEASQILKTLDSGFNEFLDQGDSRVKNWPLMKNPFASWVMIAAYVYFVKVAGPRWMKSREPFQLRQLMIVYNFAMVIANLYLFIMLGRYSYFDGYCLCQPVDYSTSHKSLMLARAGWLFYLLKFVEFADTIFFVLRKKYKQVTVLHVVHHSLVPFSLWFGIKFAPGGYNTFFPFLNAFVHVLMYGYYGVAAMGPQFQKYLFWKKYMTIIQLSQFAFVMTYAALLLIKGCDVPKTFMAMNFFHALLFLVLFFNFFVRSYKKNAKTDHSTPNHEDQDITKEKLQNFVNESSETYCNGTSPKTNETLMEVRLRHGGSH